MQVKHRTRIIDLIDTFLSSALVPAYTAAAFAKRFARLALAAPPAGLDYECIAIPSRLRKPIFKVWILLCRNLETMYPQYVPPQKWIRLDTTTPDTKLLYPSLYLIYSGSLPCCRTPVRPQNRSCGS